jgi:hypothetical protein
MLELHSVGAHRGYRLRARQRLPVKSDAASHRSSPLWPRRFIPLVAFYGSANEVSMTSAKSCRSSIHPSRQ